MGDEKKLMNKKRLITISSLIIIFIIYSITTKAFDKNIFEHIGSSLYRMLIGYVLSVVLGIITAIILSSNKYIKMMFKPLISFMMSIPTITWVPVLLIITGISNTTIILAIFLGSYFTIIYNTLDGLENVDQNLIRAAKIMGYNPIKILTHVSIPGSFNHIIVGLKLGISYSWRALVGAEMLGAANMGLGYLIFTARQFYNLNRAISTLIIIGLLGYLMSRLITIIEKNTIDKWGLADD